METHGYPWKFIYAHSYPWISMEIHGHPWISMAAGVGDENHWRADCEKLKKHKAEIDADRKRKRLPAFVPRTRTVNSLDPEERDTSRHDRKIADDGNDD